MIRLCFVLAILYSASAAVHGQRPIGGSKLEELEQASQLERQADSFFYKDGNYDQALRNYKLVIEIRSRLLGPKNLGLVATLLDMALCYRARGDFSEAEIIYKQVLLIQEKTPGGTPLAVAGTLERYSCLLQRLGRPDEADRLRARASSLVAPARPPRSDLSGGLVNGTRLDVPQPEYPKYLRKQKLTGTVNVLIIIDVSGKVIGACAVDGPPAFAQVAEATALRARFSPTTLSGLPVRVRSSISYNFVW